MMARKWVTLIAPLAVLLLAGCAPSGSDDYAVKIDDEIITASQYSEMVNKCGQYFTTTQGALSASEMSNVLVSLMLQDIVSKDFVVESNSTLTDEYILQQAQLFELEQEKLGMTTNVVEGVTDPLCGGIRRGNVRSNMLIQTQEVDQASFDQAIASHTVEVNPRYGVYSPTSQVVVPFSMSVPVSDAQ